MSFRNKPVYVKRPGNKRGRNRTARTFLYFVMVLVAITIIVAVVKYVPPLLAGPSETNQPGSSATTGGGTTGSTTSQKGTTTAAPTPVPTIPPASANPQLLPVVELKAQPIGTIASNRTPGANKLTYDILNGSGSLLASFNRKEPVSLLNPIGYQQIPGVLTFRGNNFRNAAAFGSLDKSPDSLAQIWTRGVGSLPSSSWSFSWTGTGWTGQPLLVQWDEDVRKLMNIVPDKINKKSLVEVIYATMDGNIYFYDLDDGKNTREPIKVGAPIKGTPAVDPRGWPILYVGQGDNNKNVDGIGFRIFNLIDQSMLYFHNGNDPKSFRPGWGACDSSPIFDAATDTLFYPNENGTVYTAKMNTVFDKTTGKVSINPEFTNYRYKMPNQILQGIESSMAIYNNTGYFSDNSGVLHALDLNTMKPVWSAQLEDDSDVTPVISQKGDAVAVYTGTEVDWQKDIVGTYQGDAILYKFDALTGEIVWKASHKAYTKNAADHGDDVNGGVMGTPIVGKKSIDNLVIVNFCMTNGVYSGTSLAAFDEADGSLVWEYKTKAYSWSSPVDVYDEEGNAYILLADSSSQLHLVNGKTGEGIKVLEIKKADGETNGGNIESSPAVFGDTLVIGTRGNVIVGVKIS
ncbi:MAG: PQQ-binding-like beta-propeller repeat protein [Saccharofermentanales bacterium]